MDKCLKVSVIAGGSSYTPELIEGFIESQAELAVKRIALLAYPLVPAFQVTSDLLPALLQAHRAYLPQFFSEDPQGST